MDDWARCGGLCGVGVGGDEGDEVVDCVHLRFGVCDWLMVGGRGRGGDSLVGGYEFRVSGIWMVGSQSRYMEARRT